MPVTFVPFMCSLSRQVTVVVHHVHLLEQYWIIDVMWIGAERVQPCEIMTDISLTRLIQPQRMSAIGGNNHRADFSSYTSQKGLHPLGHLRNALSAGGLFCIDNSKNLCYWKISLPSLGVTWKQMSQAFCENPRGLQWVTLWHTHWSMCLCHHPLGYFRSLIISISQFLNSDLLKFDMIFAFYLKEAETSYKNSCSVCTCTFHFVQSLFIYLHTLF